MKQTDSRLYSLDALRGLDMILLTVVGPLVVAAQRGWGCLPAGFVGQFRHNYTGFTLWDIIMPLFIFMCGAAIPFALERRLKEGRGVFWRHVLYRFALLWALGGLVQGNWMLFDPLRMTPYSNTLQSIAVGYLSVAAVMAAGSRVLAVAVPLALAAGYAAALAAAGDYTQFGNLAFRVDAACFRLLLPAGSVWIVKPSYYTWFLTSAMFMAMTFAGYHAALILRSPRTPWRKAALLAAYGIALLLAGLVAEPWIPCIKPIFTFSFTAQAMGWCALALAALYAVADIWKWRPLPGPVLLFGHYALAAYFISHFFRPVLVAFAHLVGDGVLAHLPPSAQPFVIELLATAGMVLAMLGWRKIRAR